MGKRSPALVHVLDEIEQSTEPIAESAIADRLRQALSAADQQPGASLEDKSEFFAFMVTPAYQDEETRWGSYYGPRALLKDAEGNTIEVPALTEVGPESICYWSGRFRESKHPVCPSRYSARRSKGNRWSNSPAPDE